MVVHERDIYAAQGEEFLRCFDVMDETRPKKKPTPSLDVFMAGFRGQDKFSDPVEYAKYLARGGKG